MTTESLIIELPSQEVLRSLLDYNPETGAFTWKPRGNGSFDKRFAGQAAFPSLWHGYCVGFVLGKQRAAHRIAFKYVHGRDPVGEIDHINGDRSDNRIANLREATPLEQRRNAAIPCTNSSGIMGVSYRADKGKWRAFIGRNSRRIHLGYYSTRKEAITARRSAEKALGFHANHGRRP